MGMKSPGMILLVAALVVFCGCSDLGSNHSVPPPNYPIPPLPRAPGPEPKPIKSNPQAIQLSLMEADAAFARAAEDLGAADAFHNYLSADALLLLPGEMPIKGNDAIKVHLLVNPPGVFVFRLREADASEEGSLGFTWGTYECRPTEPQTSRNRFGKYLTIWKKQPDGSWKIQVHSQSSNPSPTERR
jgi:ketosteroid isomerase-like protein